MEWNVSDRKTDLGGIAIRTVFMEETGYLKLDKSNPNINERNLNKVPWLGIVPDIYQSIANDLNFTYRLSKSGDRLSGSFDDKTGEWKGMIKDILDGEADIVASSLAVTGLRSRYVDFSLPFHTDSNTFFIRKQVSHQYDVYLKPFTLNSWCIIQVFVASFTFIFFIIVYFGREENSAEFSLVKCFIYVYGAYGGIASTRWSVTPNNSSARYLILSTNILFYYL